MFPFLKVLLYENETMIQKRKRKKLKDKFTQSDLEIFEIRFQDHMNITGKHYKLASTFDIALFLSITIYSTSSIFAINKNSNDIPHIFKPHSNSISLSFLNPTSIHHCMPIKLKEPYIDT